MSFNKIIIIGHLGRDPETKYTPAGDAVCSFSVATTERRKKDGETEETTTWFRVTCWRRLAEVAQQYLSKGKAVYVEGKLRQAEYTDRDGNRRTTLEVTASELQFLGSANGAAERETPEQAAGKHVAAQVAQKREQAAKRLVPLDDEDEAIPF